MFRRGRMFLTIVLSLLLALLIACSTGPAAAPSVTSNPPAGSPTSSAAVPTTASAKPTSSLKVRVGVQAIPPDLVYQYQNWGEKYGLDPQVIEYADGGDIMKALLAGEIDLGNGGSARLVTTLANQPDAVRIIATHQFGGDRYGVAVKKDAPYKTIQELKGKKLGANVGSGTFETFLIYLDQQGLKKTDFTIINMNVEDLRSALAQGQIDAMVAWEPHIAIAESMGVAKRIISLKGVNESPNFFLVSTKFAKEHPDAVAAFIASEMDMADFITKNPAEAGKMAADVLKKKGIDVPADAMAVVFQRLSLDRAVTDNLIKELNQVAESLLKDQKIKAIPDWNKVIDRSFLEKAAQLRKS